MKKLYALLFFALLVVAATVPSGPVQWVQQWLFLGRLNAANYFVSQGGVAGTGQSTGQRQTNCTALQAAITYANTNKLRFHLKGGFYEINCVAGLVIPANLQGGVYEGDPDQTIIVQFYPTTPGAPILTVGDNTTLSHGLKVSGFFLAYGVTQSGFTSASCLVLNYTALSEFRAIECAGYYAGFPAYDALVTTTTQHFYSNTVADMMLNGFQRDGIRWGAGGSTGNTWRNIYITAAADITGTSGCPLNFIGASASEDQHFDRLNIEGTTMLTAVCDSGGGHHGLTFTALHLEANTWKGFNPSVFSISDNTTILVNGLEVSNQTILGANMTGTFNICTCSSRDTFIVNNLTFYAFTNSTINMPIQFLSLSGGNLLDDAPIVQVNGARFLDTSAGNQFKGRINPDVHFATHANEQLVSFGNYTYGPAASRITQARMVITATDTLVGMYEDTMVIIPNSITSFTLTLGAIQGASGTQRVREGSTVRVRRVSGGASSGTLTVTNGGTSGGSLTAPNVQGTDNFYVATDWIGAALSANVAAMNWINMTAVP